MIDDQPRRIGALLSVEGLTPARQAFLLGAGAIACATGEGTEPPFCFLFFSAFGFFFSFIGRI